MVSFKHESDVPPPLSPLPHASKVAANRRSRERTTRAAKAALTALEKNAISRAAAASAQDSASRWRWDTHVRQMEEACADG